MSDTPSAARHVLALDSDSRLVPFSVVLCVAENDVENIAEGGKVVMQASRDGQTVEGLLACNFVLAFDADEPMLALPSRKTEPGRANQQGARALPMQRAWFRATLEQIDDPRPAPPDPPAPPSPVGMTLALLEAAVRANDMAAADALARELHDADDASAAETRSGA